MSEIFVSHAVADRELAIKFIGFLKEAIGVPGKSIFCSSSDGHGIPLAVDFNKYIRDKIRNPKLVILLMTPRYMDSWFCLMELGAAWAQSHNALPIVVEPIRFDAITRTLGVTQGWNIQQHEKLIDLRQTIKDLGIELEDRSEHDWEGKRKTWMRDLSKLLRRLDRSMSVPASEHKALQDKCDAATSELKLLIDAVSTITRETEASFLETDAELAEARKYLAVILAEEKFDKIVSDISELRHGVSMTFFQNLIMDRYGKAAPIDLSNEEKRAEARSAIHYNLLTTDNPPEFRWGGKKLKTLASLLHTLEDFLKSGEAESLVRHREKEGKSMEADDLQFWENNLRY